MNSLLFYMLQQELGKTTPVRNFLTIAVPVGLQISAVKEKIESSQGADFPAAQQVIIYQGKVCRCRAVWF